ncbi:plasmid rolling circle replication initiator protein Rep [Filibacter limicola]|uniref:Plasmid rolling circle replication initiator protein Rep n=1 Tax=Sporosarcina limicola TaxID=34101 RepID=A0A927MIQ6_9BACL|nr:plasmid rolling circle replication initiator protein Rep [Sporosarcina limicola]
MQTKNSTNLGEKATPLSDKKANGKEMPWREKKISNVGYYELLELLNFKKAERVANCGDILEFKKNEEGRLKLARAWFCMSPLCPMYNWRKSMKRSAQTRIIVERVIREKPKARKPVGCS